MIAPAHSHLSVPTAVLAVALAAGGGGPGSLSAQVALSFHPDTVRVQPASTGRAFVQVSNTGGAAISGIDLRWIAPDSVRLELDAELPDRLPAGEIVTRSLTITGRVEPGGEQAVMLLAYRTEEGKGQTTLSRLWIVPRPIASAADVVDVGLLTSLATLSDGDTATVHLLVENKTDRAVRVDSVRARGPEFVQFSPRPVAEIPGRSNALIPVEVVASEWVRPGTYTLSFEVGVSWGGPGGPRSGNVVTSRAVEVGVMGESEILQVLAVPSFLLLPGFLILVAFGMLWRRLGGTSEVTQDPKSVQFWLLAIGLSLGLAVLHPLVVGRNLLRGYGIRDIAWVWAFSVGAGVLAAAGLAGLRELRDRYVARRDAERVPAPGDDAVAILRKLHRNGVRDIRLDQVTFQENGSDRSGFELPGHAPDGARWVAPPAQYTLRTSVGGHERARLQEALRSDPGTLADLLEELREGGGLALSWRRQDRFDGPVAVPSDRLSRTGRTVPFVRES